MNKPSKTVLKSACKILGLICFVLAAMSLILSLLSLMNMESPKTATGNWMHFLVPAGLFIASWLFQHIDRRIL